MLIPRSCVSTPTSAARSLKTESNGSVQRAAVASREEVIHPSRHSTKSGSMTVSFGFSTLSAQNRRHELWPSYKAKAVAKLWRRLPWKAERVGFEPTVNFRPHWISSPARSATLSPLRVRRGSGHRSTPRAAGMINSDAGKAKWLSGPRGHSFIQPGPTALSLPTKVGGFGECFRRGLRRNVGLMVTELGVVWPTVGRWG